MKPTLRLRSVGRDVPCSAIVDPHVPIALTCARGAASSDDLYHWRSAGRTFLFELGIFAASGLVYDASLVLAPKEWIHFVDRDLDDPEVSTQVGAPIFDVRPWDARLQDHSIPELSRRLIDEPIPFSYSVGAAAVWLRFEGADAPAHGVVCGMARFWFDCSDILCGLSVRDLPPDSLRRYRDLPMRR